MRLADSNVWDGIVTDRQLSIDPVPIYVVLILFEAMVEQPGCNETWLWFRPLLLNL